MSKAGKNSQKLDTTLSFRCLFARKTTIPRSIWFQHNFQKNDREIVTKISLHVNEPFFLIFIDTTQNCFLFWLHNSQYEKRLPFQQVFYILFASMYFPSWTHPFLGDKSLVLNSTFQSVSIKINHSQLQLSVNQLFAISTINLYSCVHRC